MGGAMVNTANRGLGTQSEGIHQADTSTARRDDAAEHRPRGDDGELVGCTLNTVASVSSKEVWYEVS